MERGVSIVIVSYNAVEHLKLCIYSIMESRVDFPVEVVIVDNASDNKCINFLRSIEDLTTETGIHIKVHYNGVNMGYGRAANLGASLSKYPYILFLNPDTILGENVLRQCLEFMEDNEDVGALAVSMYNMRGMYLPESRRGMPTLLIAAAKSVGLHTIAPYSKIGGGYYLTYKHITKPTEIDVLSGAFMFIRRDVFTKVGGFDKRFFMYAEDIDLSISIKKAGYKIMLLPHVSILHYKGASTRKRGHEYLYNFYMALAKFANKHYPWYINFLVLPLIFVRFVLHLIYNNIYYLFLDIINAVKKANPHERVIVIGSNLDDDTYGNDIIHITGNASYPYCIDNVPHLCADFQVSRVIVNEKICSFETLIKIMIETREVCTGKGKKPPLWDIAIPFPIIHANKKHPNQQPIYNNK